MNGLSGTFSCYGCKLFRFPCGRVGRFPVNQAFHSSMRRAMHPSESTMHVKKSKNGFTYKKEKDSYTGFGKRKLLHGHVFEGNWEDGKIVGLGQMTQLPNAAARVGAVKEYLSADGDYTYNGEWLDGKYHGYGLITYPNGDVLEGEFKNNKIYNGIGVVLLPRGKIYKGYIEQGKKHGAGKLTYADGETWEGEFCNDKYLNGHGVMIFPQTNIIYEGVWVNGKRNGPGRTINADGTSVQGEFKDGRIFNGHGTLRARDGTIFEGTWVGGVMIGKGKITQPSGRTLEGTFLDNRVDYGEGVYIDIADALFEERPDESAREGECTITTGDGSILLAGEYCSGTLIIKS